MDSPRGSPRCVRARVLPPARPEWFLATAGVNLQSPRNHDFVFYRPAPFSHTVESRAHVFDNINTQELEIVD